MKWYWIVRKNGIVIAALGEEFYNDLPADLIESLKEFSKYGPIERIHTSFRITLGQPLPLQPHTK